MEPKKRKTSERIFKTSLVSVLIVFVFTMSSPSSFFQIVKPVEAAALTQVAIVPTNNIVNTRTTYDIFFKTATTGTIKNIHMTFPSGFDVSAATRLIERSGIGSGTLSAPSSTELIYTVSNPVSVPAGTTIRLEIGRVINSNTAGNFRVSIATEDTIPTIIDGPTLSGSFPIKAIGTGDIADDSITGDDVSPGFMIRKTLIDDDAGHAHGWNPDSGTRQFFITDDDYSGSINSVFVDIILTDLNICGHTQVDPAVTHTFVVTCELAPSNNAQLHYIIYKLPEHVVTSSSLSSSLSSPFASLH